MTMLDWTIVGLYVAAAVTLGIVFAKKASKNTEDFFAAGRSLPWWIAGTSLVATTFSADTPLFVAGLSRNEGIHGNWFWWCGAIAATATIFFFAKLWRRAEVLTDVEFVVIRYDASRARDVLRVFKVFFDGVFQNCIIMASVTLAGAKVIQIIMGLSEEPVFTMALWGTADTPVLAVTQTHLVVMLLGISALAYSVLSGLYGVVYTDLIQFTLAMVGSIWLAVVVYMDASAGGLVEQVQAAPGYHELTLAFVPDLTVMNLVTMTFLVNVLILWWGMAPGSGYMVQRLLATRSERDSVLAFLWYCFCHFVLRPWPWIIVGIASMIYFPHLTGADAESAYPLMIDKFLAPGIKGVMVAAILAAYMSTLDTHLNWGASYLVNDFYQPYVRPHADTRHYVWVSRAAMLVLMMVALAASGMLTGILEAYKYLAVVVGGVGTVMILRWYWWRVNAWSEIVAYISAFIVGNLCEFYLPDRVDEAGVVVASLFPVRMIIATLGPALIWITVAVLTSPKPSEQTVEFHRKIRVPGPGWARVSRESGVHSESGAFAHCVLGWLSSIVFIYAMLFGVGGMLFERWSLAAGWGLAALVSALALVRLIPRTLRE